MGPLEFSAAHMSLSVQWPFRAPAFLGALLSSKLLGGNVCVLVCGGFLACVRARVCSCGPSVHVPSLCSLEAKDIGS